MAKHKGSSKKKRSPAQIAATKRMLAAAAAYRGGGGKKRKARGGRAPKGLTHRVAKLERFAVQQLKFDHDVARNLHAIGSHINLPKGRLRLSLP